MTVCRHLPAAIPAAIALCGFPTPVAAQSTIDPGEIPVGCIPPLEPYAFAPPRDDPELYQLVNEEYQTYILDIEDYLACLQEEHRRAFNRANVILQQYVTHFGADAGLQSETTAPTQ